MSRPLTAAELVAMHAKIAAAIAEMPPEDQALCVSAAEIDAWTERHAARQLCAEPPS